MKKISLFLSMALTIFATTFVSCGDDPVTPDDPNNPENQANYEVYSVNTTLNYNSVNASEGSAFCASSQQAVPANSSSADICAAWQNQYGVVLCSPNSKWLKEMYELNSSAVFSNSKATKIQKVASGDVKDYAESSSFDNLSISSSYIGGSSNLGVGVSNLNNGDIVAFEASDGTKGVIKVSSSKVKKAVTITGYVAVPKNASH